MNNYNMYNGNKRKETSFSLALHYLKIKFLPNKYNLNSSNNGCEDDKIPRVKLGNNYDEESRKLLSFRQISFGPKYGYCDRNGYCVRGCLRKRKRSFFKSLMIVLGIITAFILFGSLSYYYVIGSEKLNELELISKWLFLWSSNSTMTEKDGENTKFSDRNYFEAQFKNFQNSKTFENGFLTSKYSEKILSVNPIPTKILKEKEYVKKIQKEMSFVLNDFKSSKHKRSLKLEKKNLMKPRSLKEKKEDIVLKVRLNYKENESDVMNNKLALKRKLSQIKEKVRNSRKNSDAKAQSVFHSFSFTTPSENASVQNEESYTNRKKIKNEDEWEEPLGKNSKEDFSYEEHKDHEFDDMTPKKTSKGDEERGVENRERPIKANKKNSKEITFHGISGIGESAKNTMSLSKETESFEEFAFSKYNFPQSVQYKVQSDANDEKRGKMVSEEAGISAFYSSVYSNDSYLNQTQYKDLTPKVFKESNQLESQSQYHALEDRQMSEPEPFFESFDGISLKDAMQKKKDIYKYLFLNNKVVGGSSDIKLPTAFEGPKMPGNTYETLKTDQQLSFTSGAASQLIFPYQMCLFANPYFGSRPTIRNVQAKTLSLQPPHLEKDDSTKHIPTFPGQNNFLSFSINNYANPPPHQQMDGSHSWFFPPHPTLPNNSPAPNSPPIFCTYLQPPFFQFPTVPGTADFSQAKKADCEEKNYRPYLYEENSINSGGITLCPHDYVPCRDGSNCIPKQNWCDNEVHCPDVSDEAFCSCRERVAEGRLCDDFLDCPGGEDEIGCFNCPKSAFSCSSAFSPDLCIPLYQRCDGISHCVTGKDEKGCSALFFQIFGNSTFQVSHSKGFLHRNWKGIWFPVCVDLKNDIWAKEACSGELGYMPASVKINFRRVPEHYKGPFLVRKEDGTLSFQDHCKGHLSTYVQCPAMKCGTRSDYYNTEEFQNRFKRLVEPQYNTLFDRSNKNPEVKNYLKRLKRENDFKSKREETGRVVGGRESEPKAWPWVAAIYKDGNFLCGGVILDEEWILTAAHCMEQYWKHFFEVRVGMLRRFSFSAMEQVRTVSEVIVHEFYDASIMSNDLALLRLQRSLFFNRWVKPACLPSFHGNSAMYFPRPLPGTHCTAIGWGALREHGIDADQLREVEVPILMNCKHKEDLLGAEICAGKAEGGKDTCQGDSGGPLMCKTSKSSLSWYVAGIVSHGEGCARPGEPGAYTRLSLFVDWIISKANNLKLSAIKPLQNCPGFRCSSGSKLCIPIKWVCNRFTDCLEAEDEKNCSLDNLNYDILTQLSSHKVKMPRTLTDDMPVIPTSQESLKNYSNGKISEKFSNFVENKKNSQALRKITNDTMKSTKAIPSFDDKKAADFGMSVLKNEEKNSKGVGEVKNNENRTVCEDFQGTIVESNYEREERELQKCEKIFINSNYSDFFPPNSSLKTITGMDLKSHETQNRKSNASVKMSNPDPKTDENQSFGKLEIDNINQTEKKYFYCRKIIQSVLIEYYCDGIQDCEDGTDEENCVSPLIFEEQTLSRSSHQNKASSAVKKNTTKCLDLEIACEYSEQCLPLTEKCNGISNCRFGEDEQFCFALVEKTNIIEKNYKNLKIKRNGFAVVNKNGAWNAVCREESPVFSNDLAEKYCLDLGWARYEEFKYEAITSNCTGLYLTCSKSLSNSLDNHLLPTGEYYWPWKVFVFSDGIFVCSAVLLRRDWLLTSSFCVKNVQLSRNYVAAKMGVINPKSWHNNAKIVRIDFIRNEIESDMALLHLSEPVLETQFSRPIGLSPIFDPDFERNTCVALGDQNMFLKLINDCPDTYLCFERIISKPPDCNSRPWIGVIVCPSRFGWQAMSVFEEKKGSCGFVNVKFKNLQHKLQEVFLTFDQKITTEPNPDCSGFRCPQGLCIPRSKICDGFPDCLSKRDENGEVCYLRVAQNKECYLSELKCRNGVCISKTLFADGKDDCGDGSDEPANPTCLEYLRLTAPHKICDGKRNCLDKTDEDYDLCTCDDSKFKCRRSQQCIPNDYICDGDRDCPDGEDEEICFGLKILQNHKTEGFELLQRSYGLWHNVCPTIRSEESMNVLCQDLGFEKVLFAYEKNQTILVPLIDSFNWVKLNNFTGIALRSDRPLIQLVRTLQLCGVIKCA